MSVLRQFTTFMSVNNMNTTTENLLFTQHVYIITICNHFCVTFLFGQLTLNSSDTSFYPFYVLDVTKFVSLDMTSHHIS